MIILADMSIHRTALLNNLCATVLLAAVGLAACQTSTPTSAPTVPVVTPTLAPITPPPAPTFAPIESPDGLVVAFVADGTLWLWRTGEDPVPLTTADAFPAPTLSSDGAWIAFTRAGGVLTIATTGADERVVPLVGGIGQYTWRPGAAELVLTIAVAAETQLQRFDPTTGDLSEVGTFGADAAFTFAPDGAHLALATPEQLQLLTAAGEPVGEPLAFPAIAISDTQRWRPTPVWLDVETVRLFTITSADEDAETVVWEVSVAGASTEVARQPGAAFGGLLAPDGVRLLFSQADQTLGLWELEAGTGRTAIDAPGAAALAWASAEAYVYTGIDPLQPFVQGVAPDALPRPIGRGQVLALKWLTGEWVLYSATADAGEQLRLAEVGGVDSLLGISSAGAIGYDALIAPP